jgi:hypothetical protein
MKFKQDHIIRLATPLVIAKNQLDSGDHSQCIKDPEHAYRKVLKLSAMRF